ncbi:phosphodiesterase [Xylanimonas allomyrinae]|uniref:Phosphodiesterase n=1 Tax=Xylanimonas allomyrinae TaxID=2509459 RepID=A0A4P6F326_9MICO|nr:phosphodiesterase [Xylanimonas allomyrinae]
MPADLHAEIVRAGYYPQLVVDVLDVALGGESVVSHLVQAETTFDSEVRRHLTVLALTGTRLVSAHVDDHEGDHAHPSSAAATTEAVPLAEIKSVSLTHVVAEPAAYRSGHGGEHTSELNLAIGWGSVSRLELEPATCGDPQCEADHGLTGQLMPDDVVVRVSSAAEGPDAVRRALAFAHRLSAATTRRA